MARPSVRYARHITEALRTETVGGLLMLTATIIALIWANTPWSNTYQTLGDHVIGPHALHLDLTLSQWAADGLLAIFFFVAGVELRHEVTHGDLRNRRDAALPVAAAVSGVAVPALVYLAVSAGTAGAGRGWAIPTATDIAFALAVLAVTFSQCAGPLRAFLLTLAVVDDLIAILIIAIFYSNDLRFGALAIAVLIIILYGWLQHRGVRSAWINVPMALLAWYFVHTSGIHATVAGVALGLLTDSRSPSDSPSDSPSEHERSAAEQAYHVIHPISAGFAVPVFAFLSAGVSLSPSALGGVFGDRVAVGVIVGLVVGKFVGVLGGAWLSVRLGLARLGDNMYWSELAAVAVLAGVGFTVSLLIGDLAYSNSARFERVTTAVLIASFVAAAGAACAFRIRVRQRGRSILLDGSEGS
jgi:Na+:H+ antiporter, NhaA family